MIDISHLLFFAIPEQPTRQPIYDLPKSYNDIPLKDIINAVKKYIKINFSKDSTYVGINYHTSTRIEVIVSIPEYTNRKHGSSSFPYDIISKHILSLDDLGF
jgi:predicted RNase H-related nuclease YkuK (DUF458 family)